MAQRNPADSCALCGILGDYSCIPKRAICGQLVVFYQAGVCEAIEAAASDDDMIEDINAGDLAS